MKKFFGLLLFLISFTSYGQLTFEDDPDISPTSIDHKHAIDKIKSDGYTGEIVFVEDIRKTRKDLISNKISCELDEYYFNGHTMSVNKVFRHDNQSYPQKLTKKFIYYSLRKTELTICLYILKG
jgi:hypothetical protein